MNMKEYAAYLVTWLEEQRKHFYQLDGYVLGISGGIDSAVAAALLARTGAPVYPLMLPAAVSSKQDLDDAELVLKTFNLTGRTLSIAPMYDLFWQQLTPAFPSTPERLNVLRGNLMARLRMVTLFTVAQSQRAVVIGTDNAAEIYMGYCTKFGDGAADLLPLAQLRKEQVFALARELGVPQPIIDKAPSAGLWAGQTDEEEMGVSYTEIDAFLRGEMVSDKAQERIDFWHQRSHHKRIMPPSPLAFENLPETSL